MDYTSHMSLFLVQTFICIREITLSSDRFRGSNLKRNHLRDIKHIKRSGDAS